MGTSNANPHPDRRQSGILLEVDSRFYLFDCGDGVPSALWNDPGVDLHALDAVFLTHRHPDHAGGVFSLLLLVHQRVKHDVTRLPGAGSGRLVPPVTRGVAELPILVPGEREQAVLFSEMAEIMHLSDSETAYKKAFHPFNGDGPAYADARVRVSSFPTWHVIDACGFLVETGGKRLLISGDVSGPAVVATAIGTGCDVVVIENAHFPPADIARALAGRPVGRLVVTHRKDEFLRDPAGTMAALAPLAREFDVILADDGLVLDL